MKKKNKKMILLRKNGAYLPVQQHTVQDGLEFLKSSKKVNFLESVDVAINLGIDSRQSDQNIRNYVVLPYSTGKKVRIAVFTQGESIKLVKSLGVDLVGSDDLYSYIKKEGCKDLDLILASSDMMMQVSKLGSILGPKGLMPNLKMGTVSQNIIETVKNFKSGKQIRYKNDKNGIVHSMIGKIDFNINYIQENLEVLIQSIKQVKPIQCKGVYIKKIFVSTTMGRSVLIDKNSLRIPVY